VGRTHSIEGSWIREGVLPWWPLNGTLALPGSWTWWSWDWHCTGSPEPPVYQLQNLRLENLNNYMSQLLLINLFPSLSLSLSLSMHTPFCFCFCGEPWIIQCPSKLVVIQSLECMKCVRWMTGFVSPILGQRQWLSTVGQVSTVTSLALPNLLVLPSYYTQKKSGVPATGLD
jgi:hypothetical protein